MFINEDVPGKLKSIDELHPLLMSVKEVVVLDIETTGFSPDKHAEIIEIGALRLYVERSKIVGQFSTFVCPANAFTIPPKITEVTQITWDDVAEAPFIEDVLPKLASFIGNRPIVAHNAVFDWTRFLVPIFQTVGLHIVNDAICTMLLAKNLFPKRGANGYNLESLCNMYGVSVEGHHRAYVDCRYTASLFLKFIQEYRYRHENENQSSLLCKPQSYVWPSAPGRVEFQAMKVYKVSCYKGQTKRHGLTFYVNTTFGCICYSARRRLWTVVRLQSNFDAPAQEWGSWVLYVLGMDADTFVQQYAQMYGIPVPA